MSFFLRREFPNPVKRAAYQRSGCNQKLGIGNWKHKMRGGWEKWP